MTAEMTKFLTAIMKEYGLVTSIMIALLASVLPLLKSFLSKRVAKRLNDGMVVNQEINGLLDTLIRDLGCQRAMVFQYHNGQKNALKTHFQRVSCTHERIMGVSPMITQLKSFPASMFAGWYDMLKSKGEIYCENLKDLKVHDLGLYQTLKNRYAKSCCVIGLWDQSRIPLGFVEINYCMNEKEFTRKDREKLKVVSMKICGLLMSKGNKVK